MRREKEMQFLCNTCSRNLTGKKHLRIVLGFTSGWMAPPFHAGKPVAEICDRNPEYHFCNPEHFTEYFIRKMYEVLPDSSRSARRAQRVTAGEQVLAPTTAIGPRVPGATDLGTRDNARRTESERDVGNNPPVRILSFGGPVPGPRDTEQIDKPLDSVFTDTGLGSGRDEVPTHVVASRVEVPNHVVRHRQSYINRIIEAVLP